MYGKCEPREPLQPKSQGVHPTTGGAQCLGLPVHPIRRVADTREDDDSLTSRLLRLHFGAAAGIPDAHARAIESFTRAIALDSSFSPAIEHLVVLELERGDTARVIRLAQLYLSADTASENRDGMRWSLAIARGDLASARAVLARRDSLSTMAKVTISEPPYVMGRDIESAQTVIDAPTNRNADINTRFLDLVVQHDLAMNRGRPARGAARLDSMRLTVANSNDFFRVTDALFWDGDSAAADIGAQSLRRKTATGGPVPGTFKTERIQHTSATSASPSCGISRVATRPARVACRASC